VFAVSGRAEAIRISIFLAEQVIRCRKVSHESINFGSTCGSYKIRSFLCKKELCPAFPGNTDTQEGPNGVSTGEILYLGDRQLIVVEMQVLTTTLRDVKLVQPTEHGDSRGWFAEMFQTEKFRGAGLPDVFVQDNQSMSSRGVLRGLHYQLGTPQGKLVRVLSGHIWDVAVDLRVDSPDFGQWAGFHLRPRNDDGKLESLWIPEGFAHGFLVLSETSEVLYKTTRAYDPGAERCIAWNDTTLNISWPLEILEGRLPEVSAKDALGLPFLDAEHC
jgi:dTDP-4-dehydrorhamnose 3,5-epimerase